MVMLPHSEECIKIPFVDVNCCSIAWSLWISWSPYKHRKLFSKTWVEGKPHLLYHFRRLPSCPRALQWETSLAFVNVNCSVMKRIQLFSGSFITAFTLEKYCSTVLRQGWLVKGLSQILNHVSSIHYVNTSPVSLL